MMSTTPTLRIAIAEVSPIVRSGLEAQLKRLARYKVQILHLADDARREWTEALATTPADIFILNPLLCGLSPKTLAPQHEDAKFVALTLSLADEGLLSGYDDMLPITASLRQIAELFDRLVQKPETDTSQTGGEAQSLTPREREIVVCIVKGMTNKEIAGALFLSTHTVITHRRNITKKLQIHSPSGLTIYAIMNKMVELNEINQKH